MKMKLVIAFSCALFLAGSVFSQSETVDYCTKEDSRSLSIKNLKPYRYSGFKSKPFEAQPYNQIKETVVELLRDMPYKLIFNKDGLPSAQKVNIVIYDRPYSKKNRTELFRDGGSSKEVVFETASLQDEYSTLYVEYELPAYEDDIAEGVSIKGCITITVGFNALPFNGEAVRE